MLKLLKLELQNFLSHIDTTLDLQAHEGLVLIEGITSDGHYSSNGAGKSTLLEGIVYALTGDTLRGVSVNDVVNRNQKKNTRVSLTFLKGNQEYTVTRYRKDDTMGDSLVLMEGEKDISKRLNKETQKLLEDILGISYKILVSTVLLGEGLSSRFTQLSDPEKKSLIESTLNLTYDMNKIRDNANDKLKSLKLKDATIEGEISVLEGLANVDIDAMKKSIEDTSECVRIYEETISHIHEDYNKVLAEIREINPKINLIRDTINNYKNVERQIQDISNNISRLESESMSVLSAPNPVCPTCHQHLVSKSALEDVAKDYQKKIEEANSQKSNLTSSLATMPNLQILESKLLELNSTYAEKSQLSHSLMQDMNSYEVKMAESNKDIESTMKTISAAEDCNSQLEEKRAERLSISKQITKYDYFYKLFSPTGIIINILSDAVSYINTRLSTYSEILLEKDYHINFVKGKISLVDSKGSSYQSLSNGEKRRLDIAIQFSLHDYVHMYCGLKLDTIFVDEILDTLDDIGVDNIFDILRLKLDYCSLKSIYVITHNNTLKSKFDQVVTIKKEINGNSFLI